MLNNLQTTARKLRWLRPLLLLTGLTALAVFTYVLLLAGSAAEDKYILPSLITLFWSGTLYWFISAFTRLPARANSKDGFFKRCKAHIVRGFYSLLMMLAFALTLVIVFISIRSINIWWQSYS
ncbi:hypothetical protein GCM10009092_12290 [Bowmanella denitrificans]|uniref:Uncharacterized protein n=1 Tax=Bowmanella denitrificans TaxID=366582 RepID=A0ABN0WXP3_9ALTE